MLNSSSCDYNDAYIFVKIIVTITEGTAIRKKKQKTVITKYKK